MNIEAFEAGHLTKQFQYSSFLPTTINRQWTWMDPAVNGLLSEANRWLGELNAFGKILPDVDTYIRMHALKEANSSSRIEGTQTRMETAARPIQQVEPEKRDDWQEVHRYLEAMDYALHGLGKLPLSNRLLCQTHAILLASARGETKSPGEFRRSQNWIGGSSLTDAVFIPPHHDDLPALLTDLESFWHNDDIRVPHLIRIAISHYQFETIHPFLDGNGRIGRLLITLYLMDKELLVKPCLYLSDFLERHRDSYYDALTAVRTRNDLLHWVRFFLNAVLETAKGAVATFRSIMELKQELDGKILSLGRRTENGTRLLRYLYLNPYVDAPEVSKALSISPATANALLAEFLRLGVLIELTGYRRNRVFHFHAYFKLFQS
jgi:Fic family protein